MPTTYHIKTPKDLKKAVKETKKNLVQAILENDITFEDESPILELPEDSKGFTLRSKENETHTIRGASFYCKRIRGPIEFSNIRLRVTAKNLVKNDKRDAFYADKCPSVKFTNCTFSDACDENLSFDEVDEVTIHRCIVGDPLHIPTVDNKGKEYIHDEGRKGSHGYGARCGSVKNLKVTETLFANCSDRSPQLNNENMEATRYDTLVENCIMYNYGERVFHFNLQEDQEVKKGSYHVTIRNNTFIPGPRTKKTADDGKQETAIEIDSKTPTKMKVTLYDLGTNKILYYPEFYLEESGRKYYLPNGPGLQIPVSKFLDQVGTLHTDDQDAKLKAIIVTADKQTVHKYDGYDNNPEKWPESHWKHW